MSLAYSVIFIKLFCFFTISTLVSSSVEESVPRAWWDTIRRYREDDNEYVDKGGRNFLIPATTPRRTRLVQTTSPTTAAPLIRCGSRGRRRCVPYHQCRTHSEGIGEGRRVELMTGELDRRCPLHLEVCCHVRDILSQPVTLRVASRTSGDEKRPEDICGRRNRQGVSVRISGGKRSDTQFGEFPWMAAILRFESIVAGNQSKDINLYVCGGSLLAANLVLTAAHCVDSLAAETLKVRVGEWDTQQTYEIFPHEEVRVSEIRIHPDFNKESLFNDVAILVLTPQVELAPHVEKICLLRERLVDQIDLDRENCIATGWGKDKFDGTFQNILKKVNIGLVDSQSCETALQTTRLGKYFRLHDSFICAGGVKGIDTCKGDGGAPLVCPRRDSGIYYQVGIVAWGIGCGEDGIPGVYADVAKLSDWIGLTEFDAPWAEYPD